MGERQAPTAGPSWGNEMGWVTRRSAILSVSAAFTPLGVTAAPRRQTLEVVLAVDRSGYPTKPWLDAIADRIEADQFAAIKARAKPLSTDEQAWADLIGRVAPEWFKGIAGLNAPFRSLPPPRAVKIVLGNQGGDDAFGLMPD